jgi:HK97 gp10 family phage protein
VARFETTGLDELIKAMGALGELEGEIADEMLLAGAEVVKQEWKNAAEQAGHRDTGAMISSINYSKKVKEVKDVKTVDIYPQGKDKKGVRNAEKAFILHYGTSKVPGSRFVDVADARSEKAVETVMTKKWDEYLKKRGLTE